MRNVESSMLFKFFMKYSKRYSHSNVSIRELSKTLKIVWPIYMYTWFIFTTFDFVIRKYQIRTLLYSVNLWETSNRVCYSFKFLCEIFETIFTFERIDSWIIENSSKNRLTNIYVYVVHLHDIWLCNPEISNLYVII